MKTIGMLTATRAEYGLLTNIMKQIEKDSQLQLCLFVTGTHLSPHFGATASEIEQDGFPIAEKIDILLDANTPQAISKSMGVAAISFADAFARHPLDILLVIGDRYELLPICSCALNAHIPLAHIAGGERTEGAIDDIIRGCITKMSYLHFPSCEEYRKRIIQMGENPQRVFNFGTLGIETIQKTPKLSKKELEKTLEFDLDRPYMVVTLHPTTLDDKDVLIDLNEMLKAIDAFSDMKFVFTKANADHGGTMINQRLEGYCHEHENCKLFASLGMQRYFSCIQYAAAVLGNSSSGIIEVPAFGIPTINIGDRQKGRLQAQSVLNCPAKAQEIISTMKKSVSSEFQKEAKQAVNPYGQGNTSEEIVKTIKKFLMSDVNMLQKSFYDLSF